MKIKVFLFAIAAVAALSAGIYARQASDTKSDFKKPLPEISLPDLQGNIRNISEWQNNVLIINFWATWCPPCLKEIPEFIDLQNEFSGKGLQFIGIAIEEKAPVEVFIESVDINYPILIGADSGIALANFLGNSANAVPYTIVVDKQGAIIHQQAGEFHREQIIEIISPIL